MTTISEFVVPLYGQMLGGLVSQLQKAKAHLAGEDMTFPQLLEQRLAPDMFPLSAQVRFVCLQAHELIGRLLERPWPEVAAITSLEAAAEAIEAARASLAAADRSALDAAADRRIRLAVTDDLVFGFNGLEYVRDWAIPQFQFHLVTAYAIMRAAGVPLGKADYVGHMFRYLEQPASSASPKPAGER